VPTSAVRGDPPGKSRRQPHRERRAVLYRHRLGRQSRQPDLLQPQPRHVRRRDRADRDLPGSEDRADGTLFDQSQNRSRKLGAKFSYERADPGFEALTATLGFDALVDKTEQR
jgi:iron complex outermembrane receptor protein